MRRAALVLLVGLIGASSGVALADNGLPIPTTPTVTVPASPPAPAPQLPIPTLPTPTLPISSPPVRVSSGSTPSVPTSGATSSVESAVGSVVGSGSSGSPPSGGGSGSYGYSSSSSSSGSENRASIAAMRASRHWLAVNGPKSKRSTLLTFRLARNGRVFFTVMQVSPVCRVAGHFSVLGHAGVNHVRFNGKLHGEALLPGTYRINAHARHGLRVLHVTIVVLDTGTPSQAELRDLRHSNVCGTMLRALASNGASRASAAGVASASQPLHKSKHSVVVRNQNPSGTPSAAPPTTHPSAAPFSPSRIAKNVTDPLIVAALAIAALLLGLAALPQRAVPDPRLTYVLVRHRAEVALAGGAALAAALLALALA